MICRFYLFLPFFLILIIGFFPVDDGSFIPFFTMIRYFRCFSSRIIRFFRLAGRFYDDLRVFPLGHRFSLSFSVFTDDLLIFPAFSPVIIGFSPKIAVFTVFL